ncbi:co-chaperone GrpE [Campylobacter rectus RM3267]|uniref:Protein GrpE n=2 Tax=Campylobacter rectus TaxID=203 RepID=A0A6G5QN73_CAMRE|nr:nucleotide exchange factor GrpE [Campylobacter rectus]EEF13194.1 co-chaperone GrpE [Campylobacter rectus RM3267]QCD47069.1 DnaK system nucleotide exchange factor GrpE [Campylobacter rectus]UEB47768.1 nucleotide exchange factor GrpE [Campylobacter rectus]
MNENENVELEQQIPSNFDESISFEGLDAKYIELQKQLEELTDKYYRANADFENIKKRFEKEKADIATYANEKFARDLLPVIDALEMAVNFETEGDEYAAKIKEGIYITIDQFKKCFEKNGITAIEANEDFDPNFHNAMLQVESEDVEKGKIVQVIQKGYLINGRILRPAMVSIAK